MNGPFTPLRGPAVSSSAAARCASSIRSRGSGGRRSCSCRSWVVPCRDGCGRLEGAGSRSACAAPAGTARRAGWGQTLPPACADACTRDAGPAIWPSANAAVIAAISAARRPATAPRLLHAGHRHDHEGAADADRADEQRADAGPEARQPHAGAITTMAPRPQPRGDAPRQRERDSSVDAAAAAPNAGQAQPNTAGSGSAWRASAGRKVAGMM